MSLQRQTDQDFDTIIAYDHVKKHKQFHRTKTITYLGKDPKPRSGPVRNLAINNVRSPFVGLVDDDDAVTPLYVERLKNTFRETKADIVVFRMIYTSGKTLPTKPLDQVLKKPGEIGISFAFRTEVFEKVKFRVGTCVDFHFLSEARRLGYQIFLSEDVCYTINFDVLGSGLSLDNMTICQEDFQILNHWLLSIRPKRILEFGPGASTLLLRTYGRVESLESRNAHGETIVNKPDGRYDLAFVDGPCGDRNPSVILAKKHANRIILHDTNRNAEKQIISNHLVGWTRQDSASPRGMSLFIRGGNS